MTSLKERFDKAFYDLLEAGNSLMKVQKKLDEAEKLISKNKAKQEMIKELIHEQFWRTKCK